MNTTDNQLHFINITNTCEASSFTITLLPAEIFNPQYSTQCVQTVKHKRNRLDLSDEHTYCHICGWTFLHKDAYEKHLYVSKCHCHCQDCMKRFQSSSSFRRHRCDYGEGDCERSPEWSEDELAIMQELERNLGEPAVFENVEEA
ncbi:uncharacterized protein BT62DRAFT_924375 [Guyanagaster necrorhizus]|uniref:C2H2-type domain-containing protein n=1 Tax=Guyanagaster necrorhizus TaxID=856835 RepID=A0A9P7VG48_9AGAR|nr:uncharacterized protein BT62DRAFT_924375 [Guyanagaster necrorhizus MCA 3950]KAG7439930.1 hypothetical protein BT62DRAFT_924375 [Guyanagaster necrorhizus MCA 3950]